MSNLDVPFLGYLLMCYNRGYNFEFKEELLVYFSVYCAACTG